jgi:hypothetical protein
MGFARMPARDNRTRALGCGTTENPPSNFLLCRLHLSRLRPIWCEFLERITARQTLYSKFEAGFSSLRTKSQSCLAIPAFRSLRFTETPSLHARSPDSGDHTLRAEKPSRHETEQNISRCDRMVSAAVRQEGHQVAILLAPILTLPKRCESA